MPLCWYIRKCICSLFMGMLVHKENLQMVSNTLMKGECFFACFLRDETVVNATKKDITPKVIILIFEAFPISNTQNFKSHDPITICTVGNSILPGWFWRILPWMRSGYRRIRPWTCPRLILACGYWFAKWKLCWYLTHPAKRKVIKKTILMYRSLKKPYGLLEHPRRLSWPLHSKEDLLDF